MSSTISREKYAKLLVERLPRVIESDDEHIRMMTDIQELMARGETLSPEEAALLRLMVLVVENYESRRFGVEDENVTPLEMLEHLMEAHMHTAKNLWGVIGDKGTVSKVLNGERAISKAQAKQLGDFYSVSPALFI